MQPRIARIDLHNGVQGMDVAVLAAYCNGKWAAYKLRNSEPQALNPTDAGHDEPRISNLRYGTCTVTNKDKPFIEIGMLLKRYAILERLTFSEQTDWAVSCITEYTWKQVRTQMYLHTWFRRTMESCMTRLLGYIDPARNDRVLNLMQNIATRTRVEQGNQDARTQYSGLLSTGHGVWWKTRYYSGYDVQAYKDRKSYFERVGSLLGTCMGLHRGNQAYGGPMAELEEVLRNNDDLVYFNNTDSVRAMAARLRALPLCSVLLADCGHFERIGRTHAVQVDGVFHGWCSACNEHEAVTVVDTNTRMARDNAFWSDNHDEYYSYDIDQEEDGPDEPEYEEDSGRAILDYSTNVLQHLKAANIKSSPYGDFLMGLELEMTTGGDSRTIVAKQIRKDLGKAYCVIKNDGSLPDDGLEIVTAPRGLEEHIKAFAGWPIGARWRAWDTNQCGLHVHIHSRAFTEMTLGKFLMFLNSNDNAVFLRKLAGRHPLKDTWAARFCAQEGGEILENPKSAIKGKSRERYRIVNTQNLGRAEAERLGLDPFSYSGKYDTVELRVFKASLKKARLLAQIEFAHAAVMFCRVASWQDMSSKSFLQWLQPHTKLYPNLADWFGARKSKALKDAGGAPLETYCVDRVGDDMVVPVRAVRATRPRRPLTNINEYLTPNGRRKAQEAKIQATLDRERERLAAARAAQQRTPV